MDRRAIGIVIKVLVCEQLNQGLLAIWNLRGLLQIGWIFSHAQYMSVKFL